MTLAPQWEGFDLTEANGIVVERFADAPKSKGKFDTLLSGGAAVNSNTLDGRRVKLSGTISASSATALEGKMDLFLEALHIETLGVLRINDDRYLDAYASADKIEMVKGSAGLRAVWEASFVSPSPYYRDQTQTTSTATNTADPVVMNLTYTGRAPSLPTIQIVNASGSDFTGSQITITNTTTSKQFRLFQLDLADGDTYVFEGDTGRSYFSGTPSASSNVPKRIDGRVWSMTNGSNAVQISHGYGTGGGITFKVLRYNRHHHAGDLG